MKIVPSFSSTLGCRRRLLSLYALSQVLLLASCATTLRIQSDYVPSGSLRLAQVMGLAKRDEIIQAKRLYDALIASGVRDSEIVDGSVAVARIYCCGGPAEKSDVRMAYIPRGLNAGSGDIVEIKVGRPPEKGDAGILNIVTRVVQTDADNSGTCWWDPKKDYLWMRVLYCDWMPKEGWTQQGGIYPAWFKPPTSGSTEK